MNVKAYLKQIRLLDIKINNKMAEKEMLFSLATKVTPSLSLAPAHGSAEQDKIGNIVAKINEIEKEINVAVDAYCDKKHKIILQLEQLEDERYYNLLHKRYVQYKDFGVIAYEMGYEYQVIINMHGRALAEFAKML